MVIFKQLTVCFDMAGCPNRCKHCWIGVTPNGRRTLDDLFFVADSFKPFANKIEVYSWYREPDYLNNYKELWKLENQLSGFHHKHFELLSFYRAVRDREYVPWLRSLGVREVQLTLFGTEKATDEYVGRKGAFKEIVKTIDILLAHGIAPRIQIFIHKDNLMDMTNLETYLESIDLEKRCENIGQKFHLFVHQGGCDGESENLYDQWLTSDDLSHIPQYFIKKTLDYFKKTNIQAIFGKPERAFFKTALKDLSTTNFVKEEPVFYADKDFNVYPNISAAKVWWHLGNLKTDGINKIISNYRDNKSIAQTLSVTIPFSEMVKSVGNPNSDRLFTKESFKTYIINKFAEKSLTL